MNRIEELKTKVNILSENLLEIYNEIKLIEADEKRNENLTIESLNKKLDFFIKHTQNEIDKIKNFINKYDSPIIGEKHPLLNLTDVLNNDILKLFSKPNTIKKRENVID